MVVFMFMKFNAWQDIVLVYVYGKEQIVLIIAITLFLMMLSLWSYVLSCVQAYMYLKH